MPTIVYLLTFYSWIYQESFSISLPSEWYCLQVAYFVGVQMDEDDKKQDEHGLNPKMKQLSTVGAVRVAVRSLSMTVGCSRG